MKLEHEQKDILSFLSAKCENGAESLEGLGGRILSLASDTMLCRRGGRSAEKSSEARFQTATEAASWGHPVRAKGAGTRVAVIALSVRAPTGQRSGGSCVVPLLSTAWSYTATHTCVRSSSGGICWGAREGDVHLRFAVSAIIILIPAKVSELRIKLTDAFCYVAHVVEMSDGQSTFVLNVSQAGNTYLLLLVGNPYWQLHGQHPCFFWACCYSWRCFFWGGRFRTGGITCPRTAFLC